MRLLKGGDSGADVRELQVAINERADGRAGIPHVTVDGEYGAKTAAAAAAAARSLGALESTIAKAGTSIGEQRIIRWPEKRSDAQIRRSRERAQAAQGGGVLADTFTGSPVPGQRARPSDHQTAGLPGFPAVDYFARAGSPCVAPADGKVTRLSGHDPAGGPVGDTHGPFGWSVYIDAGAKTYYLTHLGSRSVAVGDSVRQGEKIGTVGDYARWGGANHIHQGVSG